MWVARGLGISRGPAERATRHFHVDVALASGVVALARGSILEAQQCLAASRDDAVRDAGPEGNFIVTCMEGKACDDTVSYTHPGLGQPSEASNIRAVRWGSEIRHVA